VRVIAGYAGIPESASRNAVFQVIATGPGGAPTDITDVVKSIRVSDTLGRASSVASVELSRKVEAWDDPVGDPASPLAAGGRLAIHMGERDGTLVRVFEGEITGSSTGTQDPVARTPVRAVGGYVRWWKNQVTSAEVTFENSDVFVEDLFEAYGELIGPGDFDLPGEGIVLTTAQVLGRPIMDAAYDVYEFRSFVPWWDPVQLKLSTLAADIPAAADITLAVANRRDIDVGQRAPEGTRIQLDGGTLQGIERVEIDTWPTLHNLDFVGAPADYFFEGVAWEQGSKNDATARSLPATFPSPYWADAGRTAPSIQYGAWVAGNWLWLDFAKNLMTGALGADGYKGPEGVQFLLNLPMVSTDPVSILLFTETFGVAADYYGEIFDEEFEAATNRQRCYCRIGIDATNPLWVPVPAGYTPGDWWQQVFLDNADALLSWEIKGRQLAPNSLEQLSAQAWDDAMIALHGDIPKQVSNALLLPQGEEREATELEAKRQLAVMLAARYPATLSLEGQDLRILPGDCIQTPHPRDAYDVLVWAQQVEQIIDTSGAAHTEIQGFVVGTV